MKNNYVDIRRLESSPVEPVTLSQAKAQCIVTYSDDDNLIDGLITICRKAIENFCNVSIAAKTITLVADLFYEWELPYGPVTGLQSVQTRTSTQGSGLPTYQTLTSGWGVDGTEFLTFIPGTGADAIGNYPIATNFGVFPYRYKIQYTAGWPDCPDDLRQAILTEIAYRYEHRGDEEIINRLDAAGTGVCDAARVLAQPYRRELWA